jgi:hypothetical protein
LLPRREEQKSSLQKREWRKKRKNKINWKEAGHAGPVLWERPDGPGLKWKTRNSLIRSADGPVIGGYLFFVG